MKQRFILFVSTLVLSIVFGNSASAYDVKVDGIYYNYIVGGKSVEVTYGEKKYEGDVTIPSKITIDGSNYDVVAIGKYAFNGCEFLTSIHIPRTLFQIGLEAFNNCRVTVYIEDLEALCNINFADSSSNPIYRSGKLYINNELVINLIIPNTIKKINDYSFYGCDCIESVTIPNTVSSIGSYAFNGCDKLNSAELSNSINSIGSWAFANCKRLTSIVIPNSVTSISEGAFAFCENLSSITLSSSLQLIEEKSFQHLSSLKTIIIPNSVGAINRYAFYNCSKLSSVVIGKGTIFIRDYAFSQCVKLDTVTCQTISPPYTSENVFDGVYISYATLIVPPNSVDSYKNSTPWNKFGSIKVADEIGNKCETPTISYTNGKLSFSCATESVEYVSEINSEDVKKYYSDNISLKACYNISVRATRTGYEDSDLAEAKLYWLPTEGTLETNINTAETRGVMASSANGFVTLSGLDTDEQVSFYATDGRELGTVKAIDGTAHFAAQSGTVVIAKIGKESLKIAVK